MLVECIFGTACVRQSYARAYPQLGSEYLIAKIDQFAAYLE